MYMVSYQTKICLWFFEGICRLENVWSIDRSIDGQDRTGQDRIDWIVDWIDRIDWMDGWTDGRTDQQTDRQTDKQTDRQIDR